MICFGDPLAIPEMRCIKKEDIKCKNTTYYMLIKWLCGREMFFVVTHQTNCYAQIRV